MEKVTRYTCGAGDGMFTDKEGHYVDYADYKNLLDKHNQTVEQNGSLLKRAIDALDDYLNAGCKETRKQAAENAKVIYKEYHGVEYSNRNER